jgi:threonine dehydrogenase-like Zn-dependent dehydrogenase
MDTATGAPETMRAAVTLGQGRVRVEERPVPEIAPDEALVAVSHCGVCGTDLHFLLEGMGRPGSIQGHEYAGRIAALGSEVRGFAAGAAVVGGPRAGCGRCGPCAAGRSALCVERPGLGGESGFQGAFAEYVRVHASQLVPVPDALALREAALAEPLSVALHAIGVSEVRAGQRVLVTGAGPLGLLLVAALRAHGIEDLRVSEPAPLRRRRAQELGATRGLLPEELRAPAMPYRVAEEPVDVAFECSGRPEAMESALGQLAPMGRLVLVGTGLRKPRFDHNRILLNELVVTGAYGSDEKETKRGLELLASGRLPTARLIEPRDVPLDGLLGAAELLGRGELAGKVMVAPGEGR